MTLTLLLDYYTHPGERLALSLNTSSGSEQYPMHSADGQYWTLTLELAPQRLSYEFLVLGAQDEVLRREASASHQLDCSHCKGAVWLRASWLDQPLERMRYTAAYRVLYPEAVAKHAVAEHSLPQVHFLLQGPALAPGDTLCLLGSSQALGAWQPAAALPLSYLGEGRWMLSLPHYLLATAEQPQLSYKYVLRDAAGALRWEEGADRSLELSTLRGQDDYYIEDAYLRLALEAPRIAGCVVPLFALRSSTDWGVGDFAALEETIEAVAQLGMHALQLLPINDTTYYRDQRDSYPYNAISVDALHPIYISIDRLPRLSDQRLEAALREEAAVLRHLETLDYPAVLALKERYLRALFSDVGAEDLRSVAYQAYYRQHAAWLRPYSYYCVLRDRHPGMPPSSWVGFEQYDATLLADSLDAEYRGLLDYYCWLQYRLSEQLLAVRTRAEEQRVFLKGDLPIGVAPHGLDQWLSPSYFHSEQSAGAPPDDFAADGQNWGFPTYAWEQMRSDDYRWWQQRLEGLSQYFHAFRIDHILGFFRIWEVPRYQRSGLLGHFHPAAPYSLEQWQQLLAPSCPVELLIQPLVHQRDLLQLIGAPRLKNYLQEGWILPTTLENYYTLRFGAQRDYPSGDLAVLAELCTETALIADPYTEGHYHPRISWERSHLWQHWDESLRQRWQSLYEDYYYQRHNELFRDTALERLSGLIRHTQLLLCAEDLGMIPATVPEVLEKLQIASLELERMPKHLTANGWMKPEYFPRQAVVTTSTHDMPPLRAWWHSLSAVRQQAYLEQQLEQSESLDEQSIYRAIVEAHLASPAQLALLPLSDWMSTQEDLWLQSPEAEQINHPEDPHQYWCYRFPSSLPSLIAQSPDWVQYIRHIIHSASRIPTL